MSLSRRLAPVLVVAALLAASPARAYRLSASPDAFLDVDVFLQFWAQAAERGAPDGSGWGKDFYFRRARLILGGELNRHLSFFFDTEQANWGRGNDWSTSGFYISDAFLTAKVSDAFMVDAGLFLMPFTRHGYQSAVSLNGLDFHLDMMRMPEQTHKGWRDVGVQLRGYLVDRKLQYRVALMSGGESDPLQFDDRGVAVRDAAGRLAAASNPKDYPRFLAHLRYNLLGTETGFFASGIAFVTEPVLSMGASVDVQPDAGLEQAAVLDPLTRKVTTPARLGKYVAAAGDLHFDVPLAGPDHELAGQLFVLRYWQGAASRHSGTGVWGEIGYRWKWIEPLFAFDWFRSDLDGQPAGRAYDLLVLHAGLNAFVRRHVASLKLDVSMRRDGDLRAAPFRTAVTLQAQLFL